MKSHGQITLDGAMDVSVTDAEALATAIGWQIQGLGGRTIDVRHNAVLVRFGEREYMIGIQEVGIWGARKRATRAAGIATAKDTSSYPDAGERVTALDRAQT